MGNLISGIKVRVNGKEVNVKQRLVGEGDDSTLTLTFEIGSLNDKISMDMTVMGFMNPVSMFQQLIPYYHYLHFHLLNHFQ